MDVVYILIAPVWSPDRSVVLPILGMPPRNDKDYKTIDFLAH